MKKFLLLLLIVFFTGSNAYASDYPSIEDSRNYLNGDTSLAAKFEACADELVTCALAAGQMALKQQNYDDAEEYFLKALNRGHTSGALGMIMLKSEQANHLQAYAWSQVVLHQRMEFESNDIEDHRRSWAFMQLALAAQNFSDDDWVVADEQAQALINLWMPALTEKLHEQRDCLLPQPIKQRSPNYPRKMLNRSQPGWVQIDFRLNEKGRVDNQVAILFTDQAFAVSGTQAVKNWQFEPWSEEHCDARYLTQILTFHME